MVLADAKVLVELLDAAGGWLGKALKRARKARDKQAAHVLHDSFVVVASMRAYDNTFRPMLGQLLALSTDWEADRSRELSGELSTFFDVEKIMPRFRQAFQGLRSSEWEGAGHEPLGRLLDAASTFGDEIAGRIRNEKEDLSRRSQLFISLKRHSEWDVDYVRKWATRIADVLDRDLLAEADHAFGELRQAILAAHDLPDPGYAVSLE
jgi:hypothetical protein